MIWLQNFLAALKWRLKNSLIALDQLAGALILGIHADMTISAQAWLWHLQGRRHWPHRLIDTLFAWDHEGEKRHCELSFESEQEGKQLPPEARPKEPP